MIPSRRCCFTHILVCMSFDTAIMGIYHTPATVTNGGLGQAQYNILKQNKMDVLKVVNIAHRQWRRRSLFQFFPPSFWLNTFTLSLCFSLLPFHVISFFLFFALSLFLFIFIIIIAVVMIVFIVSCTEVFKL